PSHPTAMRLRLPVSHRLLHVQEPRPFLRRHGRTASSSRCMVDGESRWSWMMGGYKLSSCSKRVNVGPNASVTSLAFLGFPFVDSHQP
ncbi:hypothetical protein K443DRAFT_98956, partial [Laccaria amethystina LaAM-08-1]